MKIRSIMTCTAIMLLTISLKAFAVQIVPIPLVNMTKAAGVFSNTAPDQAVLVTSTGNATLTGDGDMVVIEQGGNATIYGDNEKVYMKNGATATITGSDNIVYYENGSKVTSVGGRSRVTQVDGFNSSPS